MFGRRRPAADVGVDAGARHVRAIGPQGDVAERRSRARRIAGGWLTGTDVDDSSPPRRPLDQGRIADPEAWAAIVAATVREAVPHAANVLVALPHDEPEEARQALPVALSEHGLTLVGTVPTHVVAAIGADLPLREAEGSLVVLAGASRVEVAVLSLGGTVVHRSVRAGLDAVDAAIAAAVRRDARAVLTSRQVRRIRRDVVDASPTSASRRVVVTGRRLDDGSTVDLSIDGALLAPSLAPVLDRIGSTVLDVLRETPPELCADLVDRGVILLGGGASQRGLDARLQQALGLPVLIPDRPAHAIARGLQALLRDAAWFDELVVRETA